MDSTERFSERVENYRKYRPGYPQQAIDFLYHQLGFSSASRIADIGAGTGIFSRYLLQRGSELLAIEPNDEMRAAAEAALHGFARFRSLKGTAEHTGLEEQSVDYIVSAQAFHWFDLNKAQQEFKRILKPAGKAVLIWNSRQNDDAFSQAYEELLMTFGTDYQRVKHTNLSEREFASFFKDGNYTKQVFHNEQIFDLESLTGRLLSSSYTPLPDDSRYDGMIRHLGELFAQHQRKGEVRFHYQTEVYAGEM